MLLFKLAPVFLVLAVRAHADKKIELQDIEEDNLKSEKQKDGDTPEGRAQISSGTARELLPLEFLKNGLLRYFETPQPQQPRYVQQYAVTEPPEKPPQQPHYATTAQANQGMVGYLSNVPMQIYLVPHYYGEQSEQTSAAQHGVQYISPTLTRFNVPYHTAPEAVPSQNNYVEVPAYVTPTGKAYVSQYPQVTYVSYSPQPTAPSHVQAVVTNPNLPHSQATVNPMYPMVHFQPNMVGSSPYKYYSYPHFVDPNAVDETENEVESPKYSTQTEIPYTKSTAPEFPRYYTSRVPVREDQRHSSVPELPHPSPLLLRSQPPHLSGIPKVLPMFRPFSKPIYSHINSNLITQRPSELYGISSKKRPASLLDSYIPSSVQVEYLKRGLTKDPLSAYDALANSRHNYPQIHPRQLERGFLPNQVYHTAAGGITYGHYKRTPKSDKVTH